MKTSELTGAQLDYWVARAECFQIIRSGRAMWISREGISSYITDHGAQRYSPSVDWAQGGPLITKHRLNISETDPPGWVSWSNDLDMEYGDTPLQAICRAVVRAAFGDEVEEVLP